MEPAGCRVDLFEVDLDDVRWDRFLHVLDGAELGEDICHASELPGWRAGDAAARRTWFYRAWTRKEAYAKALGTGLYERFGAIHFGPGGRPGVCEVFNDDAPARRPGMFVHDLAVPDGFAASLCIAGADARLVRAGDGLPA